MPATLSWTEEFLVKERRRILLVVVPLCVVLCAIAGMMVASNPVYVASAKYLYLAAVLVLSVTWLRVRYVQHTVSRWALVAYITIALVLVARIHMLLGTTLVAPDSTRSIFDGLIAAAPVLYISVFLVLPLRQAIYCAFSTWLVVLLVTTWHLVPLIQEPVWRVGLDDTLMYTYAVSPIFIGICWMFASYQTALKESEERIRARDYSLQRAEKAALIDALTGIPNRRAYEETVPFQWDVLGAEAQPAAFLMIDVDWFKNYNDELGHQQGDRALQRIAATIADTVNGDGRPYRYGGEEFAVLLSEVSQQEAQQMAAQIRERISGLAMFAGKGKRVTVSIGVAYTPNCADESARENLRRADMAMFDAKAAGRNRVVVASNA